MKKDPLISILGIFLIVIGLLGFVPNPIIGKESFFASNALLNLIHLFSGILLLRAKGKSREKQFISVMGIFYVALAVLGMMTVGIGEGSVLRLILLNGASNILHLVLGGKLLVLSKIPRDKIINEFKSI